MQINNIIFMGTPDFAVPCLDKLHQNYNVTAVITQPDRPKGRGQHLAKSPVKIYAEEHNLPVYQPEKIKTAEFTAKLRQMQPDLNSRYSKIRLYQRSRFAPAALARCRSYPLVDYRRRQRNGCYYYVHGRRS